MHWPTPHASSTLHLHCSAIHLNPVPVIIHAYCRLDHHLMLHPTHKNRTSISLTSQWPKDGKEDTLAHNTSHSFLYLTPTCTWFPNTKFRAHLSLLHALFPSTQLQAPLTPMLFPVLNSEHFSLVCGNFPALNSEHLSHANMDCNHKVYEN